MKHHNYGYKFAFKERTSCDKVRAKLFREMKMAQLIIGIIGMLSIIGLTYVPNTSIYFDTISALFVIGVSSFYVLAVGGSTLQKISRFGKAALHAATLGFFIGLAGIAAMDDPPVAAQQVAIFVLVFGYVIHFVCSAIVERYENEGND
jgi:hypothetical protein